ncbi:hypothetical protein SAMN04487867_12342 [Vreelandella titanicae]|uniref:Uncharacterized protein n=1 Tax=Vreelandella titanicae TaxID=664683 RepID=A0AAP9NP88_9GAMM|nr:hypothetical protein FX987_03290 [Halomonas titanicae]SDJ08960.1 hypothetical protein SAMN04487867_12342 [Halomonas titanicae]
MSHHPFFILLRKGFSIKSSIKSMLFIAQDFSPASNAKKSYSIS